MKKLRFILIALVIIACADQKKAKQFHLFKNIYEIDSIAGKEELADPRYIVLTKDSLFAAFGYWDYSYPYETELRIDDSLRAMTSSGEQYLIQPAENGFWLSLPNGNKYLYTVSTTKYDSAYKHLRIMKTQESILLGKWKVKFDKTEAGNILGCQLTKTSLLRFTRSKNQMKVVELQNLKENELDTCFHKSFRLDGSSILIFDYHEHLPYKILQLDKENLILQDYRNLLYFSKVQE